VAFWGRNYVEGYECKGNVEFFIHLGLGKGERARKVREKVQYLNQLALKLKGRIPEVKIYLASFAINVDMEFIYEKVNEWIRECDKENKRPHFEVITIKDFLEKLPD